MKTLNEFGQEVVRIREAVDSLEVKGERNASLVVYCYNKCNDIIIAINEAANEMNKQASPESNQPDTALATKEEGEVNEQDSRAT